MKDITELFLKRECQFSESIHPSKKRYEYVFRERSIDDGSHFDPRLDKYPEHPKNHGTLRSKHKSDDKKSDKKFDSLKKVFINNYGMFIKYFIYGMKKKLFYKNYSK